MQENICNFSALRELRKREKLSIAELAARSGVAPSVISKLERNCSTASLETLYRIAKVFQLTLADLISLAEQRTSHRTVAEHYLSGDFRFDRVSYGNLRCMHAQVKAGDRLRKPELHRDDDELCWVLKGRVRILLPEETAELSGGMSIQFDALLPHTYEAVEDGEILIVHRRKEKRF